VKRKKHCCPAELLQKRKKQTTRRRKKERNALLDMHRGTKQFPRREPLITTPACRKKRGANAVRRGNVAVEAKEKET